MSSNAQSVEMWGTDTLANIRAVNSETAGDYRDNKLRTTRDLQETMDGEGINSNVDSRVGPYEYNLNGTGIEGDALGSDVGCKSTLLRANMTFNNSAPLTTPSSSASTNSESWQLSIKPDWLLHQKLMALVAENRVLKEMLWDKQGKEASGNNSAIDSAAPHEAKIVADEVLDELITKTVFLGETHTTSDQVCQYLSLHSEPQAPPRRRRGRPPKNKQTVAEATCTSPDVADAGLDSDKVAAKRKNPHPRRCTSRYASMAPEEAETLPPRRQKLIAKAKVIIQTPAAHPGVINGVPEAAAPQESASDDDALSAVYDPIDDDGNDDVECEPPAAPSLREPEPSRKRGKHRKIIRHRCKLCGATFTHGRPFKRHLSGYPRGSCCCRLCRKEFISLAIFLHHDCDARKRAKGALRRCRHCALSFTNLKKFIAHVKDAHQERAGEPECFCKYCDKGFIKRATMYKHYVTHAPPGHTVCSKCGEFVEDAEEAVAAHDRYHLENAKHVCGKCGATFMRRQQYEQHTAAHARYDCPICNGCYSTRKALEKHQRVLHGIKVNYEQRKYYCDRCGKSFARPGLLEIHTRVHTGEKPIECGVCHLFFRTPKALNKHKQTYTHMSRSGDIKKERDHLCQICGKAYFRKQALQRHMRYHTGEKPYKCPHCEYICRENNNLKRHIALHFSQRDYVCETCGAAFHAKKTLETHRVYKHSDTRNFHCEECPMSFKTPNSLRRHMRIHANARPHKCGWCGTGFNRLYNLRRHLRSVHGNDEGLPAPKRVKLLDVPLGLEYHKGSEAAATGQSPPEAAPPPRRRSRKEKVPVSVEEAEPPKDAVVSLTSTALFHLDEHSLARTSEPVALQVAAPGLVPNKGGGLCGDVASLPVMSVPPPTANLNPQMINQIVNNTVSLVHGYYQEPDGSVRSYTLTAPPGPGGEGAALGPPPGTRSFPVPEQQPQAMVPPADLRQQEFHADLYGAMPNFLHFMQNNT